MRNALADSQAQLKILRDEQLALREERQKLRDEKETLALEVHKQSMRNSPSGIPWCGTRSRKGSSSIRPNCRRKLDDVSAELAATQRRMAQGSQQLQGEVLELAIEEALRRAFSARCHRRGQKRRARWRYRPSHNLTFGVNMSASCSGNPSGPRTGGSAWIVKLKEDMRGCGADIGVLGEHGDGRSEGLDRWATVRTARGCVGDDLVRGRPARRGAALKDCSTSTSSG